MRYLLCFVAIALMPVGALSWWRTIPLDEAVKDSDVIIVARLENISEETKEGTDYGAGELVVDEVLWGAAEPGQKLYLAWENGSGVICPRLEHKAHENKQLIWLLKLKSNGKVAADNPGRFIKVENKASVIKLARSKGKSSKALKLTAR